MDLRDGIKRLLYYQPLQHAAELRQIVFGRKEVHSYCAQEEQFSFAVHPLPKLGISNSS